MTYHDLLAAAQQNPQRGRFPHAAHGLRARTPTPRTATMSRRSRRCATLPAADFDAALDAIARMLEANYLDIEAHIAADYVHTRLDQPDRSAYHRGFAQGLLGAIFDTGMGGTSPPLSSCSPFRRNTPCCA